MHTEQLQVLVKNLRAEVGHSLSPAQGVNQIDALKYLLARTQEEMWTAFMWPELIIRADVQMQGGQYIYNYPSTMTFDMIRSSWTCDANSANWGELDYGIDEDQIKPDGTNNHRADPVQYWAIEGVQFRVWPTPNVGGNWVRFKGMKPLAPLLADTDVCSLDATAIVLLAGAELLARAKAEDAATKQQKAQRHLTKLLANRTTSKSKISSLGGGSPSLRLRNSNIIVGNAL